jgi:lysophospholipase L1-like esterase
VPFDAAIETRVRGDLTAIAQRNGAALIDLSHELASEHFGNYKDGSPDNFHYDAAGHATVAARIAAALFPRLESSRAGTGR